MLSRHLRESLHNYEDRLLIYKEFPMDESLISPNFYIYTASNRKSSQGTLRQPSKIYRGVTDRCRKNAAGDLAQPASRPRRFAQYTDASSVIGARI
jgi:hypothetical protein